MSRQCEICGKKPLKASKLSFSHKHNVYRQVPNLQNIKVDVNGKVVKMKVWGPYILYTIVRIKSILNRYKEEGGDIQSGQILGAANDSEKALMMALSKLNSVIQPAFQEKAPHKICSYIYELANAFNSFYHETKILGEENEDQKTSWIQVLILTRKVLETCIGLLGFEAPDRM